MHLIQIIRRGFMKNKTTARFAQLIAIMAVIGFSMTACVVLGNGSNPFGGIFGDSDGGGIFNDSDGGIFGGDPYGEPTFDKLSYTQINGQWRISAANKSISGAVVIPSTWDNRSVQYVATAGFEDCTGITSVTFPATIVGGGVAASAFIGCTNLTMVVVRGNRNDIINAQAFEGDLSTKLRNYGPGTYTRDRGGRVWDKID
jgi:hypothetical protein